MMNLSFVRGSELESLSFFSSEMFSLSAQRTDLLWSFTLNQHQSQTASHEG